MPFDPTAFAEAAREALGIGNRLIGEAVDQKHEKAHIERVKAWSEAQSIKDASPRADASWLAIVRLLSEGGQTAGGNGANTAIPIDTLSNLFELASAGIMYKAMLNRKE